MIFKGSLFNKGLLVSDLKRFWWVSALYGLLLFLILPFSHMMQELPAEEWARDILKRSLDIFGGSAGIQALLICVVPVVLGVLVFGYLHSGRAAAWMHSLPCTRLTLFLSHSAAGLALLFLPVIINGLVLALLNITTPLQEYYSLADIFRWMGMTALFDALVFALTVLVGMFTGNTAAHLVLTYILQVLPNGLHVLMVENLSRWLHGYTPLSYPGELPYNFPLMMFASGTGREDFTAWVAAAYLLATVITFGLAYFIYRLRQVEAAGDVVAFPILRPVFKYGVTACCMLLAGAYFAAEYRSGPAVILWGYFLGSFVGYFVAEALLQKSLKVWSAYRGYLVYGVVVAVLVAGLASDVTGYVRRVPDPEEVRKVYFGSSLGQWIHVEKLKDVDPGDPRYGDQMFFEDRNNIAHIVRLHHELAADRSNKTGVTRYIIYTLADGTHLARRYEVDEREYASFLKPIYESLEYKEARFPVLNQDPEDIKMVVIDDHRVPKGPVVLSDREEIREFTARLKQDILGATFEEMTAGVRHHVIMDVVEEDGIAASYALVDGYRSVMTWLKQKGYYEGIILLPEEVEYVVLETPAPPGKAGEGTAPRRVEIRNRRLIEELLNIEASSEFVRGTRQILVTFYGKTAGGPFQYESFIDPTGPVSEELKIYIKQLE
ncbi:DUF6449 domain-containing protein [Thermanaeromonas sp. C210]|uniref:DUF6449 domain-containing protein n=1 Tax=Thermanaeromonas sp. C210 TaxID=2731925 RepID=UPI00155D1C11|nr:DUF6449 domain-containing protein [Thermanaeromonas sp. C210]GFN23422.1 hypothetical protein TAMC210_17390 [Thermanaeromonas sp. C210]